MAGLSVACLFLGAVTLRRAPVSDGAELLAGSLLAGGLMLLGAGLQAVIG